MKCSFCSACGFWWASMLLVLGLATSSGQVTVTFSTHCPTVMSCAYGSTVVFIGDIRNPQGQNTSTAYSFATLPSGDGGVNFVAGIAYGWAVRGHFACTPGGASSAESDWITASGAVALECDSAGQRRTNHLWHQCVTNNTSLPQRYFAFRVHGTNTEMVAMSGSGAGGRFLPGEYGCVDMTTTNDNEGVRIVNEDLTMVGEPQTAESYVDVTAPPTSGAATGSAGEAKSATDANKDAKNTSDADAIVKAVNEVTAQVKDFEAWLDDSFNQSEDVAMGIEAEARGSQAAMQGGWRDRAGVATGVNAAQGQAAIDAERRADWDASLIMTHNQLDPILDGHKPDLTIPSDWADLATPWTVLHLGLGLGDVDINPLRRPAIAALLRYVSDVIAWLLSLGVWIFMYKCMGKFLVEFGRIDSDPANSTIMIEGGGSIGFLGFVSGDARTTVNSSLVAGMLKWAAVLFFIGVAFSALLTYDTQHRGGVLALPSASHAVAAVLLEKVAAVGPDTVSQPTTNQVIALAGAIFLAMIPLTVIFAQLSFCLLWWYHYNLVLFLYGRAVKFLKF